MAPPLLCIMGPTASGKTALAIALAEALDGELISVDSALVYRGLDIGSAKPAYPHHLVDICDPAHAYSAATFAQDARTAIDEIEARGRRPILVGGTMLYFRALLQGLAPMPPADAALRARLEARAGAEGWPALHAELAELDPRAAQRIHPNHSQRILRALEVCLLTGRPISDVHGATVPAIDDRDSLCVALSPVDRAVLHARIKDRLDAMLKAGFLEEVRTLHRRGDLHAGLPAIRSVGYRQLWAHLEGEVDLATAVERATAATRQLAKRQYTWLRKWPGLNWLVTDADGALADVAKCSPARLAGMNPALEGPPGAEPSDALLRYLSANAL